jgi:CBS domain-containing protein
VKIEDIMTRNVRGCSPEDSLGVAAQIMWENDCGAVPVIDSAGRIVGIITDRDICMASHLQGGTLRDSTVASCMARDVKCCAPTDTPATVQALMQQNKIRRVPVIDRERRLIGMIALSDLAYVMSTQQTLGGDGMTWTAIAHTLAAVSEPRRPRYPSRFGERAAQSTRSPSSVAPSSTDQRTPDFRS